MFPQDIRDFFSRLEYLLLSHCQGYVFLNLKKEATASLTRLPYSLTVMNPAAFDDACRSCCSWWVIGMIVQLQALMSSLRWRVLQLSGFDIDPIYRAPLQRRSLWKVPRSRWEGGGEGTALEPSCTDTATLWAWASKIPPAHRHHCLTLHNAMYYAYTSSTAIKYLMPSDFLSENKKLIHTLLEFYPNFIVSFLI